MTEGARNNKIPDYKSRGWTSVFGFTLIELLVVVLIIGILAAVALPQYQKVVAKTRLMQYIIYAKEIQKANELYKMANGHYTEDVRDLDIDITAGARKFDAGNWTSGSSQVSVYWQGDTHCGPSTSGAGACMVYLGNGNFFIVAREEKITCLGYSDFADSVCRSFAGGTEGTPHGNGYTTYPIKF